MMDESVIVRHPDATSKRRIISTLILPGIVREFSRRWCTVLFVLVTACTRWKDTPVSPHTIPNERSSGNTRLVLRDGSIRTLSSLSVRSDSAIGYSLAGERVAIPLREIAGVRTRDVSGWSTAAFLIGLPLLAVGLLLVLWLGIASTEGT